jgi:hypothetical protein
MAASQPTTPQLTTPNPNVGAAEGCDLLILKNQSQKIAAFGELA